MLISNSSMTAGRETAPAASLRPVPQRGLWWTLHHWVGVKLNLVLVLLFASGTLATLAKDIDWLITPAMRATEPYTAAPYDWQGMIAAARKTHGDHDFVWITAPKAPWFNAELIAYPPGGGERIRIHIDPGQNRVAGTSTWFSMQRLMRDLHRNVFIPEPYGVKFVALFSLLLTVSLVSGLMTYKKFWRGFFRRPRGGNTRRMLGDVHRLMALWLLPFIIVTAATSLWYLIEAYGGDAPPFQPVPVQTDGVANPRFNLNHMRDQAAVLIPGFVVNEIWFPRRTGEAYKLRGQAGPILVRPRANEVQFDARTGAPIGLVDARTASAHQRISEAADPLHFGSYGGFALRLVYGLFGAMLTGLALTGVMIHARRVLPAAASSWRSLGRWRWANAALLLLPLVLLPVYLS